MPRVRKPKPAHADEPVTFRVDAAFNSATHAPLVSVKHGDAEGWTFTPQDARTFARLILDKAAEAEAIYLQKQTLAHVEASINQTIARLVNAQTNPIEAYLAEKLAQQTQEVGS